MTTNTADQGLTIPDYPESADGPLAFYQFTTSGLESRLIKRYLSSSDRLARNPTPQPGELSFLADSVTWWVYKSSLLGWIQLLNADNGKGVVYAKHQTSNGQIVAGISAETTFFTKVITNLEANRVYRISLEVQCGTGAGVPVGVANAIKINGTSICDSGEWRLNTVGTSVRIVQSSLYLPGAVAPGSTTWTCTSRRVSGSNVYDVNSSSTSPFDFSIWDIGGVPSVVEA